MPSASGSSLQLVGHVGVDSGLVWVGDPSRIVPDDQWNGFVDKVFADQSEAAAPLGELAGLAVHTPDGDGAFPVYVRRDGEGRIIRVEIDLS